MITILSDKDRKVISSNEVKYLIKEYCERLGEDPPRFNYQQYKSGQDMFDKLTEAIQTGKPIIPKKELSMFDI